MSHDGADKRLDPGTALLVDAVQRLSLARNVAEVQEIVRVTARAICGADGATFVLRDGDFCHYVDEDAISPLWKGQQFPLESCISGWSMLHRRAVAIEDIYADDRIPHDAYRPTFVQSLAMVPIRRIDPIGAIGNYWATRRQPTARDMELLQALADSTAVALENVRVWGELEARVADRTAKLEAALKLNERVLGTLAHEVRNCLTSSLGLLELALARHDGELPSTARHQLELAHSATADGVRIVTDQLTAARDRAGRLRVVPSAVDVTALLHELSGTYYALRRDERVRFETQPEPGLPPLRTDRLLLLQALRNLVSNAFRHTAEGRVRVSAVRQDANHVAFVVADTGTGIPAAALGQVLGEWEQVQDDAADDAQRGVGLGLPFVHRIAQLLGGELLLASEPGSGTTVTLTIALSPDGAEA